MTKHKSTHTSKQIPKPCVSIAGDVCSTDQMSGPTMMRTMMPLNAKHIHENRSTPRFCIPDTHTETETQGTHDTNTRHPPFDGHLS